METLYYSTWHSPIGPLTLIASERGLVALEFGVARVSDPGARVKDQRHTVLVKSDDKLASYRRELEKYFAGKLRDFTVPLDLRGTDFQMHCWHALLEIPYGQTRTTPSRRAPSAGRRPSAPSAWPTTTTPSPSSCPAIA